MSVPLPTHTHTHPAPLKWPAGCADCGAAVRATEVRRVRLGRPGGGRCRRARRQSSVHVSLSGHRAGGRRCRRRAGGTTTGAGRRTLSTGLGRRRGGPPQCSPWFALGVSCPWGEPPAARCPAAAAAAHAPSRSGRAVMPVGDQTESWTIRRLRHPARLTL